MCLLLSQCGCIYHPVRLTSHVCIHTYICIDMCLYVFWQVEGIDGRLRRIQLLQGQLIDWRACATDKTGVLPVPAARGMPPPSPSSRPCHDSLRLVDQPTASVARLRAAFADRVAILSEQTAVPGAAFTSAPIVTWVMKAVAGEGRRRLKLCLRVILPIPSCCGSAPRR